MNGSSQQKAIVAIDLGAQSCRVSLLRWRKGEAEMEVVHRFANDPLPTGNGLRWDIDAISNGVVAGLHACAARAPEGIASVAVDGWAVDYVRLDESGKSAALPYCYRDPRTERAETLVHGLVRPSRLYALTGIQILRINTLYQLFADALAGVDPSLPWLNVPEFISYQLSGRRVSEYTNATHTGLIELGTQKWCREIFAELGLHLEVAPQIVPSGTMLGPISAGFAALPEFRETRVIVPACHDTASAIAAIPAMGDDWAFISSGTWSLVGTVLETPCVSEEAQRLNFTNLGGVGGKICFLKNVNGMWLLRQCMEEWEARGIRISLKELIARCESMPAPETLVDVDDPELMLPGNAIGKINTQLERVGQARFASDETSAVALANLVFHSMAARYAEVLDSISRITGKKLQRLFIVGGGSQNGLLNRQTAERTGLEVIPGAVESSTIGNFAVQASALEEGFKGRDGVTAEGVARWAEILSKSRIAPAQ